MPLAPQSSKPSFARALRLAAMAVGERLRRGAARAIAFAAPNAAGLGQFPRRFLGAVLAIVRAAVHPVALFLLASIALPFALFLAQTSPSGPLLPVADHFFMSKLLADESFLDMGKPDLMAGRCADGHIGRRAFYACGLNGFSPVAPAPALFDDAIAAYRGKPLAGLSPERAAAARDLAASMAHERSSSAALQTTLFFELVSVGALLAAGLVAWALVVLRAFPSISNALDPFAQRFIHGPPPPPGAPPPQAPFSLRMMMLCCGMMISLAALAAALGGAGLIAAQRLAPGSAAGDWAFAWLAERGAPEHGGSPMELWETRYPWLAAPNSYAVARAGAPRRSADASPRIGLGSWTSREMLSGEAPALLAQRAPSLTPDQRDAALLEFRRLELRARHFSVDTLGPGLLMAFLAGIVAAVLFLAGWLLRSLARSSRRAIDALADEGAQLPLARSEREDILDAVDSASSTDDGERPRRGPRRL